jgi:hypothetical protein
VAHTSHMARYMRHPRAMDAADFHRIALSLESAEEGSHMGAADFRVGEGYSLSSPRKARATET